MKQSNTEFIIAYGHNVTYITDFTSYKDTFFDRFYNAFKTTTSHDSKEKDRLAVVEWNKLKTTINDAKFNSGVEIVASVHNPQDLTWKDEKIILRGFFVKKHAHFGWINHMSKAEARRYASIPIQSLPQLKQHKLRFKSRQCNHYRHNNSNHGLAASGIG